MRDVPLISLHSTLRKPVQLIKPPAPRGVSNFKAIADYETGSGDELSAEKATAAVEGSRNFVDVICHVLSPPNPA